MFSLFRFVKKIKSGFMSSCRARCPDNLIKGLIQHRVESFFHVIFAVADYFTFAIIEPFCPIVIVRALFKKEEDLAALIVKRFKIGFITCRDSGFDNHTQAWWKIGFQLVIKKCFRPVLSYRGI